MKILKVLTVALLLPASMWAASLSSSAKMAIPYDIQQLIQVDYRVLNNSTTGTALKNRLMPEQLKSLESSLKQSGLNEDDIDTLTFALFRTKSGANTLRLVGIAQGNIPVQKMTAKLKKQKAKSEKYRDNIIYPLSGSGMSFCMLDDSNMLFGEPASVKQALDARDGQIRNVNYNGDVLDTLASVQDEPIWSILDAQGTQAMLKSALGEAGGLADFDTMKKRLLGSSYKMDFSNGVNFKLDVKSSDSMSAATLSSLMKAGALYKKMSATPSEKAAIEDMTVDSSGSDLLVNFHADDNQFVSLVNSPMFQAFSR